MTSVFPDGDLAGAAELGTVTDRSVRVWVREPGESQVTAALSVAGQPPVSASIDLSGESDWTGSVTLETSAPAPGEPFVLAVGGRELAGRLAPAPGAPATLTFGFGSCHMPFAEDAEERIVVRPDARTIYPAIRDDLQRAHADLLVLIGDQIYADELSATSVRADLPDDPDVPPPITDLLERYRRNYRGFFNESGFRRLRQSFPTLCMWDDHDIFDNWGSTAEKTATDFALFDAASRAYREYQHARNPASGGTSPPFGWTQQWGDIAIVALDLRGSRDYEHGTMLGAIQWDWFRSWLAGDGAREVATLFVISSVPVAHVARWFSQIFDVLPARISGSVRDRWTSSGFINSRDVLLDTLLKWQAKAPQRQVVILSGDVHVASAFSIRDRTGAGVIRQVTSSAMTTPLVLKQTLMNRLVVHGSNLFEPRYRFQRHLLSISHNIGIARLWPLRDGGHRVSLTIRCWDDRWQAMRTAGRLEFTPDDHTG